MSFEMFPKKHPAAFTVMMFIVSTMSWIFAGEKSLSEMQRTTFYAIFSLSFSIGITWLVYFWEALKK